MTTNPPQRPVASYVVRRPPVRPEAGPGRVADQLNERLYAEEFDALPIPNPATAELAAREYTEHNLRYIPSRLPAPPLPDPQAFLEDMAKRQWHAGVRPQGPVRETSRFLGQQRPGAAAPASRPIYGRQARDWEQIRTIQRVNAYTYRGDKLPIQVLQRNQGFLPSVTRTDPRFVEMVIARFTAYMQRRFGRAVDPAEVRKYIDGKGQRGRDFVEYEIWRAILEGEQMHLGRMVADEFMKGYISTTRLPRTAWSFASGNLSGGGNTNSLYYTVFALHVPNGFLLPAKGDHAYSTNQEGEIAHPGVLPWSQVLGFRTYVRREEEKEETHKPSRFIFMRKGFARQDPEGFEALFMGLGSLPP